MSKPKKPLFETKKQKERRLQSQDKLAGYVEQGLTRVSLKKQSYQDRCGHCKGSGHIGGGKTCGNCGGVGTITRFR